MILDRHSIAATLFFLLAVAVPDCPAFADDHSPSPLTDDEISAMSAISEGRVLSTVSFLSSDEMAGRDTPSAEFDIACSYVAARFRGAGLESLGDDKSYYQLHELQMIQAPDAPAEVKIQSDQSSLSLPLLLTGNKAVDVQGKVMSEDEALAADNPSIASIDEIKTSFRGGSSVSSVLAICERRISALKKKGVRVVLMKCDIAGPIYASAEALHDQPQTVRGEISNDCSVVLYSTKQQLIGKEVQVRIDPMRRVKRPIRNVVGVLRGSDGDLKESAIVVTAHLDHIGKTERGKDRVNNGADDNATGVTAVLSLADAISKLKSRPKRSIVFATFWGEEQGMKGSKQFVANPPWPLANIHANINIEMVGRPEKNAQNKAWMTGWRHSNLGEVMNAGSKRVDVEIFNRTDVGEMLYSRSDNISFVQKGVIAHSFSAGSLHSDYHQPSDEWSKLDIPHMTQVIRGLYAGILHVAETPLERTD